MAENSKGGILNKTEKFLRRRKTKVCSSIFMTEFNDNSHLRRICKFSCFNSIPLVRNTRTF